MVVAVSPCTTATSFGFTRAIASRIADPGNTRPHSASMACTSAPARSAISTSRWPNRPKFGTSTRSPGFTSDRMAASMPAREVPSTSSVASLPVAHTAR